MPSRTAIAQRRRDGLVAINERLATLAGIAGVAVELVGVVGPASRDPDLREAMQTEQAVAALDAIVERLNAADIEKAPAPEPEPAPAPAVKPAPSRSRSRSRSQKE